MIGRIRQDQVRILAVCPVKSPPVYNHSPDLNSMAIHILGSGVNNNIRSKFKWFAQYRRCKCVVYDERHTMCVSNICKFSNVQYV
ncbi:hypothetical protein D3C75_888220 [compost metagenome]